MFSLPLKDRLQAGRLLAEELSSRRQIGPDAVVLALTRGGVPVGAVVADRLHLPLDIIVVRKIGVPWQPELAMGAITSSDLILDEETIGDLNVSDRDVREVVAFEQANIKGREALLRDGLPALDLCGRPVVLIDDGLATGCTMLAAVRHARNRKPSKLIVAVPVASDDACDRVREALDPSRGDELVCLATPYPFHAVGEWYRDFSQTSDTEVRDLLAENRRALCAQ
jgi:putative phosphoribosyl transferase